MVTNFQRIPLVDDVVPEKTLRYPELCEKYKKFLLDLPDIIPQEELDLIVHILSTSFYIMALQELDPIVISSDRNLNLIKRLRVEGLLRKAQLFENNEILPSLFSQQTIEGYRVRIIKPGYSTQNLAEELATIGNCWIGKEDLTDEHLLPNLLIRVEWLQRDINAGACIYLIGEEPDTSLIGRIKRMFSPKAHFSPKLQTRLYVALTKEAEPILFLDSIESGITCWSSIHDWVEEGRGKELLYSVAAAIYIAREYGIEKIGIGEYEVQQLATSFGFKEKVLFSSQSKTNRKIGLRGDKSGLEGPYVFLLFNSKRRRVIKLDDVTLLSENEITTRLSELEAFLNSNKKIMRNILKMEEVEFYLVCLEAINESGAKSSVVAQTITKIRDQYLNYYNS